MIMLQIIGWVAILALPFAFLWAMSEAQIDIPGVNEPNTYGPSRKDNNG